MLVTPVELPRLLAAAFVVALAGLAAGVFCLGYVDDEACSITTPFSRPTAWLVCITCPPPPPPPNPVSRLILPSTQSTHVVFLGGGCAFFGSFTLTIFRTFDPMTTALRVELPVHRVMIANLLTSDSIDQSTTESVIRQHAFSGLWATPLYRGRAPNNKSVQNLACMTRHLLSLPVPVHLGAGSVKLQSGRQHPPQRVIT